MDLVTETQTVTINHAVKGLSYLALGELIASRAGLDTGTPGRRAPV